MKIFDKDYEPLRPLANNVLMRVTKEEFDSVSKSGLITAPQRTVFNRACVVDKGPEVHIDIEPGDFVELSGMAVPTFFDEDGKCTLMLAPQDAVIAVYKAKK